jgi:signal transduction histidine kinase
MSVLAQSKLTEAEIEDQLKNTPADTLRVKLLNELAWKRRNYAPVKAIELAQEAHDLAEALGYLEGVAKSFDFKGVCFRNLGDYTNALLCYQKALETAQNNPRQDSEGIGFTYINIGNIYMLNGDYPKAMEYMRLAEPIAHKRKDRRMLGYVYLNRARVLFQVKNYQDAIENLEKCRKIRIDLSDSNNLPVVIHELGNVYFAQGNFEKAQANFQEAVRLYAQVSDNSDFKANLLNSLSKNAFQQKNFAQAAQYAQEALLQAFKVKSKPQIVESLKNLIAIEKVNQNFMKALKYHEDLVAYKDSSFTENLKNRLANLELSSSLREKDRQNQIHQEHIQAQRWFLIGISMITIVLLGGALFYFRANKIKRQHNLLLLQKNQEIENKNLQLTDSEKRIREYNQELLQLNEELHANFEILQKSQEQYKQTAEELTKINQEKDSLVGIVAHDLKSPLNRLKGILDILQISGNLNPEQEKYRQLGFQIIENGSNLIRDLLDINYFEHPESKLNQKTVNMNRFIENQLLTFKQEANAKNITLHFTANQSEIFRKTDENCLSRILTNLISNAIKFSPIDKNVFTKLTITPEYLQIEVQDEGLGFSAAEKEKVFQKFQKFTARPTGGENSTGLGLSIIKVLTEKLNGEIRLESEVGVGSRFILTFPDTAASPQPSPKERE